MRSGGYTLHHSLTVEATAIVKQAVSLARRRGHAQVSPLHVASAMLASPAGLLKRACLQSHSHPLQCKALELCFNVALNRLPNSASAPVLGPHSHLPSLSNALVAAFKRAQAHQRRGSIENQQQPILALKVEIEQLVISILDDPSVSRVMREAGFSSTQVKSNVEHHKSSSQPPIPPSPPPAAATNTTTTQYQSTKMLLPPANLSQFRDQSGGDVGSVVEAMSGNRTRNVVVVGESAEAGEGVVRKVMEKFERREVPQEMRTVQFISVPLLSLRDISKEEFEAKLGELRSLVKSYVGRGVVLYLGDLDWVSDFWCKCEYDARSNVFYSPVEYMIMELSRLVCGSGGDRLWLMGVATFQTYAKCTAGRPSLQTLWSLHPLTLPLQTTSLALGLSLDSGMHDQISNVDDENCSWRLGMKKHLVCCWDCEHSFNKEAQAVIGDASSTLPSWLQQYKDEKRKELISFNQESDKVKDLCKKWNSICSSVHKKPHFLEKLMNLSSSLSPSSSASASSTDHKERNLLNWPGILDCDAEVSKPPTAVKPELLSNPNSSPNSASSSEASQDMKPLHKFDELNSENHRILTAALEKKVQWQKHIVPEIATAILRCRSGTTKKGEGRRESWLAFIGGDDNGKELMAKEIAKVVFGSEDDFLALGISRFSSKRDESTTEEVASGEKRGRDEQGGSVYDRFAEAVGDNPRRVLYVEDVDEMDYGSVKGFERAIRDGGVLVEDEFLPLKDAIVVFSLAAAAAAHSTPGEREKGEEQKQCGALDLNIATEDGRRIVDSVDMQVVFTM
ncbi:protein SMAX1-LIKE 3-like [Salvia splendens]|uniref:protein SMAX1-LIKE 3-like n=1 Tax=Salvia splendens TaxID=180675 RepID=UPI00110389B4|nr:protein SMAX1-LIKE 3-like [Salvia splendens]